MDRFDIHECSPVDCLFNNTMVKGTKYTMIAENVDRVAAKAAIEEWTIENGRNDDFRLYLYRAGDACVRPLSMDVLQDPEVLEASDADRRVPFESTDLEDILF